MTLIITTLPLCILVIVLQNVIMLIAIVMKVVAPLISPEIIIKNRNEAILKSGLLL
jgi:hypothetical protein